MQVLKSEADFEFLGRAVIVFEIHLQYCSESYFFAIQPLNI